MGLQDPPGYTARGAIGSRLGAERANQIGDRSITALISAIEDLPAETLFAFFGPAVLPRKGAVLGKRLLTVRLQGQD